MNELQIINISGVDCYEKDGVVYLRLEAVARGLGFTKRADSGNEVVNWTRVRGYLADLGVVQKCTTGDFIPENIFYRLAMKAKNEVAEAFQAKIADEVIPSIRKHGSYAMNRPPMSAAELIAAQANLLVEHESKLSALAEETKAIRRGVEDANSRIVDAVNVFSATSFSPDTWQEEANRQINEIVEAHKLNHQSYRSQLYERLERISGVNLQSRQTRMRNRMKEQGKTRRQQNAVTKLYIIAQDKQLRLIFDSILREEKAKRICAGWGA